MKFLLFFLLALTVAHAQTLTLGVFAYRSAEKIMEEYQPIAEHISHELNISVLIKPLDQKELENEVNAGNIDIISTNPTHYLSLQKQGKTTGAIATVVKRYGDVITPYLGGVIITRADRKDIRTIADLKNKTIAIPNKKMLGGYLTQTYELFKAGINIAKDCKTPIYKSHFASAEAVISGEVDAGFVRSGILEEMAAENKLNMNEVFVINALSFPDFPLKISTNLYAEWPIVASRKLDVETVSKIAVALYSYKNNAIGNDIISAFTISGDYSEIDTLARLLRIPPYDKIPSFTLEDIWHKHGQTIFIFVSMTTLFFVVLGFLYRKARFERKYAQSILNATPGPIIVTNGTNLISANTAFLKLVHYETLEAFLNEHDCVCDYFEEGGTKEYLSASMNEDTWVAYILANPKHEHKVKMTINGVTKFFKVAVSVVEHKNLSRYIVIFDDISQLLSLSTVDTCTRASHLATPRICIWPADASTLGHLAH
jgi:ABC-type phosphate/phosphonate transport system substrate-binding protein